MLSPNARITLFYFSASMTTGAINGFGGIWLQSRGISVDQIGLIFAIPIAAAFLFGMQIGRVADRARDWRTVIVIGALVSASVAFGLLTVTSAFAAGLVWAVAVTARMLVQPVIDAASMRRGRREDDDFASLYAWKTVGYLALIFVTGVAVERFGIDAFLWVFLASGSLYGCLSLLLPRFRETGAYTRARRRLWIRSADRAVLLPLLGWSLVHCTHSVLNAFLGVLWVGQGVTAFWVGVLIAFSGAIETGVFATFRAFLQRFQPTTLIVISCAVGVIRWAGFALSPPIEVLFLLQALQGFTYAVGFLACTNLIADMAAEEVAAEAQSAFQIMQMSIAFVVVVVFGYLVEAFGAQAFFVSAMLAAIGAGFVIVAIRQSPSRGRVAQ
jgi:PPP family 3-phenylpropionic acid transporter